MSEDSFVKKRVRHKAMNQQRVTYEQCIHNSMSFLKLNLSVLILQTSWQYNQLPKRVAPLIKRQNQVHDVPPQGFFNGTCAHSPEFGVELDKDSLPCLLFNQYFQHQTIDLMQLLFASRGTSKERMKILWNLYFKRKDFMLILGKKRYAGLPVGIVYWEENLTA